MSLQDQMAADLTALFLNTGDFASAALYFPGGGSSSFACVVILADVNEELVTVHSGTAEKRQARATASRTALRTGIQAIETTARDPDRGDVIVVASGDPMAGRWFVETAVNDVGDGVQFSLRYDTRFEVAGTRAVETTG